MTPPRAHFGVGVRSAVGPCASSGSNWSQGRAAILCLIALTACEPVSESGTAPSPLEPTPPTELDLAVLPPSPEFAGGPRFGHVVEHGDLPLDPLQQLEGGAVFLRFSDLAAPQWEVPGVLGAAPPLAEFLAPTVLENSGRRAAIHGFATLERSHEGAVTALMLTPLPPGCCFGRVPRADERVHVELPADLGLTIDPWRPLRVVGTFVAEERRDVLGLFEGLYFLSADQAQWL